MYCRGVAAVLSFVTRPHHPSLSIVVDVAAVLSRRSKARIDLPSPFEWADGPEVRWALGFLESLLQYLRGGNHSLFHGKVPADGGGRYHLLDELLRRAAADAGGASIPPFRGNYSGLDGSYDALAAALAAAYGPSSSDGGSARPLPVDFLRLQNNLPGTRVIWNINDIPVPPLPYSAKPGGPPLVETRRRRLCARRAAILGERPTLITGPLEANAIREFGHVALKTKRRDDDFYEPPPKKALLLDRGRIRNGPIKSRAFANVDAMVAVLNKYEVEFDLVTDRNVSKMTFPEQARLFSQYGLVIVAHGAGETNFAFLPRRAAVIEISPVLLWCPLCVCVAGRAALGDYSSPLPTIVILPPPPPCPCCHSYHRFLSALGHSVFPIFSRLKGPLLEWNIWLGENATLEERVALAASCERKPLQNIARMSCWHEARNAAVMTPIHEFEHVLLRALDTIFIKKFPRNSSFDLIEGVAQFGPDVPFWREGHYEAAGWKVCPPTSECTG